MFSMQKYVRKVKFLSFLAILDLHLSFCYKAHWLLRPLGLKGLKNQLVLPILISLVLNCNQNKIFESFEKFLLSFWLYFHRKIWRNLALENESEPLSLKITNLHRKWEIGKTKNMGTWQNWLSRFPCFQKCKKMFRFLYLLFSNCRMFFSKI